MSVVEASGPIKFAKISTNATADIVAAVTGKAIRVLQIVLTVTTASGTVKFQSDATVDLTGAMLFPASGMLSTGFSPCGLFQTASGKKLTMVLASAGQVSGFLVYQEVLAG